VNAFWHTLHWKGLSPVWVRMWIWRAELELKFLRQTWQKCLLFTGGSKLEVGGPADIKACWKSRGLAGKRWASDGKTHLGFWKEAWLRFTYGAASSSGTALHHRIPGDNLSRLHCQILLQPKHPPPPSTAPGRDLPWWALPLDSQRERAGRMAPATCHPMTTTAASLQTDLDWEWAEMRWDTKLQGEILSRRALISAHFQLNVPLIPLRQTRAS